MQMHFMLSESGMVYKYEILILFIEYRYRGARVLQFLSVDVFGTFEVGVAHF